MRTVRQTEEQDIKTGVTMLIVALRSFVNAPKNEQLHTD